jgi:hypothetical protein
MLNRLWRLFRPTTSPAAQAFDVPQTSPNADVQQASSSPAPLINKEHEYLSRERDQLAWEHNGESVTPGNYSWTYDGTTVTYSDRSWEYHEPDAYRPKPINDRFYNELSPLHVNELLSKWANATQKGRVREPLERAAQVAYMRRKHSDEARSLGDLLTQQCIQAYPERCSWTVFEWRAKLLAEQRRMAEALELLTKCLKTCQDDLARQKLLKALRALERKAVTKGV